MYNFNEMKKVDVQTVDRASLVDLKSIRINKKLSQAERIADFIRQIKNPYCYICEGIVVKEVFSDNGKTIDDCIEKYISATA